MCAICGWYSKKSLIDSNVLINMNQAAKHRGPDDEGYVLINEEDMIPCIGENSIGLSYKDIRDNQEKNFFLGFGHRRLSIIELSASGHQPMISENAEYCITFNGEIYNYSELREILMKKGHFFNSKSDTEVLLHSYIEWGEECVSHFNGMWAFSIFDKKKKIIFCSRDRLGAKPFYYYVDDDNFIFSSELKQLVKHPIIPRYINENLLATQLMWSIADYSEETLIKDVKILKGGQNLVINISEPSNTKDSVRIYSFWEINTNAAKSIDAIREALDYHLDAVKIRTRSDVPIGVLLSGGLDSSSIVAEIADYYKKIGKEPSEINTYTSCYNDFPEGDEREFAELVNRYCGVTQNLIYPDTDDTFSTFSDMVWFSEGLCSFYSMGSFLTLKKISEMGAKVIINGQGADETMFGYERYYTWYLIDCLRRKGVCSFIKEFKKVTKNSNLSAGLLLKYIIYFNNITVRKMRCKKRMMPYVSKEIVNLFNTNKSVEKYMRFNSLADMQYNEIRGTQLPHILRMDDRSFMAFSIESRVPFIDYRYVEASVRIPEIMKIGKGYTKYLLRKNIEGKLPEKVIWRKNKMGWPSPEKRWVMKLDEKQVHKLFINPRSERFFNVRALKKLWRKNPGAYAIEKFMSVEIFMRLFDIIAV